MHYQLSQRALVHSIWITQPPLSKSKLEVMLFFVMHTTLVQTGLNWPQLTKAGADVICRC